jgi:hypothetical protein
LSEKQILNGTKNHTPPPFKLNGWSLKYRRQRQRGDMIETFKIMLGIYDKEVTDGMLELDENTRTRDTKRN